MDVNSYQVWWTRFDVDVYLTPTLDKIQLVSKSDVHRASTLDGNIGRGRLTDVPWTRLVPLWMIIQLCFIVTIIYLRLCNPSAIEELLLFRHPSYPRHQVKHLHCHLWCTKSKHELQTQKTQWRRSNCIP